jgi:hypothetical protein
VIAGDFDLRHVTAGAIGFRDRAQFRSGAICGSIDWRVTSEAFRVIVGEFVIHRLMRVVTCNAADTRIVADETFAQFKPIRLESHGSIAMQAVAHHGVESTVTMAAEIRYLLCIKMLE